MPDLSALLREHLSNASLPPEVEEELVSHLTDLYDAEISSGLDEDQALDVVRNQLGDPVQLLHAVRQYKESFMANFPRYILVPGLFATALTTLAGNMLGLYRLNHIFAAKDFLSRDLYTWCSATSPRGGPERLLVDAPLFFAISPRGGPVSIVNIDLPLLLAYLFAGSFAAIMCMHLGGDRRQRIWASLVPAAVTLSLSCWAMVEMWSFVGIRDHVINLIGCTILPAAALLIGALPFLTRGTEHPAAASRRLTIS